VSDAKLRESSVISRTRRFARIAGALALAGSAMSMVANALTIRDRAGHTGEAESAPNIATASWITALICVSVLLGVLGRLRSTAWRPSPTVLSIAGATAVMCTYLVHMWTASLWV
jgi:peptidoglycan biosynthesis protein MviN/MurJ (putative lipid II flippase)